jgi:CheY-like chemotaxis protein
MKASGRRGRSGRQKILVIEDDPVARADLQARLKAQGYTVALAADAASALTVVNRERPDLILLDLGLPAGNGFLVLERLRKIEALAAIPVLVLPAAAIRKPGSASRRWASRPSSSNPCRPRRCWLPSA